MAAAFTIEWGNSPFRVHTVKFAAIKLDQRLPVTVVTHFIHFFCTHAFQGTHTRP